MRRNTNTARAALAFCLVDLVPCKDNPFQASTPLTPLLGSSSTVDRPSSLRRRVPLQSVALFLVYVVDNPPFLVNPRAQIRPWADSAKRPVTAFDVFNVSHASYGRLSGCSRIHAQYALPSSSVAQASHTNTVAGSTFVISLFCHTHTHPRPENEHFTQPSKQHGRVIVEPRPRRRG